MESDNENPSIPLLWNHDHTNPVGLMRQEGMKIVVSIDPTALISEDMFFQTFGGAGVRVTECKWVDGVRWIQACEILEFSLCPMPAADKP